MALEEYTAAQLLTKSTQRQNLILIETKTKIMEALLTAATQYGKTECALDPTLFLEEKAIYSAGLYLTFVIRHRQ